MTKIQSKIDAVLALYPNLPPETVEALRNDIFQAWLRDNAERCSLMRLKLEIFQVHLNMFNKLRMELEEIWLPLKLEDS